MLNFNTCTWVSDKNECLDRNGGCEQDCENTEGSYTCSCRAGYLLGNNGLSCYGILVTWL